MYVCYDNQYGDGYVFDDSGAFIGIEEELVETNPELFYSTKPVHPYVRNNQPAAFPYSPYERMTGMSMVEYYAGKAIVGLLAAQGEHGVFSLSIQEKLADAAFEIAEAMITRSRRGPKQLWSQYSKKG